MKSLRVVLTFWIILTGARAARSQDFKERFVGKAPCSPELQSESSDLSFRLDKTRNTELRYRNLGEARVLMIVQSIEGGPTCGVIRDVVQIKRFTKGKHYEFRCFDSLAPTDVVIGTIVRGYGNTKLMTAIDAWRIDLKEQKFVETHHKVVCSADGFDGEDDGRDLADAAKQYAAHGKPGQFD